MLVTLQLHAYVSNTGWQNLSFQTTNIALEVENHKVLTFKPYTLSTLLYNNLQKHATKLILQDSGTFPSNFTSLLEQLIPLPHHQNYFLTEWNTYIAAIFSQKCAFSFGMPHMVIWLTSLSFWAWEVEQPCMIFLAPD